MAPHDPRKVPRQRRARETVRAMLDATAHILAAGEALSTNRVAEVAGVSIGSLYQYFPTKEALVAALVERMLEHDLVWAREVLGEGPLRPELPRLVDAICERHAGQASLMAAVLPLLSVVARDTVARRAFEGVAAWLHERLEHDPDLRPELADPERRAKAVFVATRALRWALNEAALDRPAWLSDPDFRAELVHLLDGLWRRGASASGGAAG